MQDDTPERQRHERDYADDMRFFAARETDTPETLSALRSAGWAPGSYIVACIDCGPQPNRHARDWRMGDKRAIRCRPCAEKAVADLAADAGALIEASIRRIVDDQAAHDSAADTSTVEATCKPPLQVEASTEAVEPDLARAAAYELMFMGRQIAEWRLAINKTLGRAEAVEEWRLKLAETLAALTADNMAAVARAEAAEAARVETARLAAEKAEALGEMRAERDALRRQLIEEAAGRLRAEGGAFGEEALAESMRRMELAEADRNALLRVARAARDVHESAMYPGTSEWAPIHTALNALPAGLKAMVDNG